MASMKRYKSIFQISLSQEFAYRLNFIMWRLRNVLQVFAVFYLWDTVFSDTSKTLLGYDRSQILTYVFLVLFVKAIVFSTRSIDVAGEISRGELTNYLLRPINYFYYWLTRDLSSKALNIGFSIAETIILIIVLKPPFFLQTNLLYLGLFLIALILAILIYYLLMMLFSFGTFWVPEQGWGLIFLLFVSSDILGGTLYPIDILPNVLQQILYATPFPYLVFMPIQIYLGKLSMILSLKAIAISFSWVVILAILIKKVWQRGLISYEGAGR